MLASQLGASRVFAIEPTEIIQVAREVAAANGCAGKIEFFEELSHRVTLPVRADVIVSDLRGVLPFFERHIPVIVDARRRFLAPGGTMIPRKDMLWAAVVETPTAYGEVVDPWEQNLLGQDLHPARQLAVNTVKKVRASSTERLTEPRLWTTLDYASVESSDVRAQLEWTVERPGTGHGIIAWFDTELTEGVSFSNAPGSAEGLYDTLFFPWIEPVPLSQGQIVCVSLEAKLVEEEYIWRWTTKIEPFEKTGASMIHFEQSQLHGAVLSTAKLRRTAADYVPRLSEEGRLRSRAFQLMDGRASMEEIAKKLAGEFPQRFSSWRQALSYAGAISREFSR